MSAILVRTYEGTMNIFLNLHWHKCEYETPARSNHDKDIGNSGYWGMRLVEPQIRLCRVSMSIHVKCSAGTINGIVAFAKIECCNKIATHQLGRLKLWNLPKLLL